MRWLILLLLLTPVFAETMVYVPAVMQTEANSIGVLATVTVSIKPGTGHVYVDTQPLTEIDTQSSARIAKEVLEDLTGINMEEYDFFFTIRSDSPIIGGPSAGGAMTAAAIADFLNLSIDKGVIMTGTINPDGSIGPIGGVFEKARAVSKHGHLFLIPEGQGIVQVQKTEGSGMVKIISKPIAIDIVKYAKENWNLDVKEVSNVKEAIKYMTSYEIKEKEHNKADLNIEIMKNMASSLVEYAKNKLKKAEHLLDNTGDYKNQLESIIKRQKENIKKVDNEFKAGNYYSASSRSFIVSIYSSYVINFVDFFEDKKSIENKIILHRTEIDLKNKLIDNTPVDNVVDIEIIAAARERLKDAENNIGNAFQSYYNRQYSDAIYYASYIEERLKTSDNWINLASNFSGEEINFSFADIKPLAQRRIEDAAIAIVYSSTVGVNTASAQELLENARIAFVDEDYSTALFNAIMAKSIAEMEMETRGTGDYFARKVESYRKRALIAIENSQKMGAVPILAVSYLEYGESFVDEDTDTALMYMKYSKEFADVSADLRDIVEGKSFEKEIGVDIVPVESNGDYLIIGLVFIIGLITGVVFPKAFKL